MILLIGRRAIKYSLLLTIALCINFVSYSVVLGQSPPDGWDQITLIFGEPGWKRYNDLVSTPDGTVHVFWQADPSKANETQRGTLGADNLWYTQIQQGKVSEPINILVPPPNSSIQQSIQAAYDKQGQLHLFLWSQCLQHSFVSVQQAFIPQEWMKHRECIENTRLRFGVTSDGQGQIHLVFGSESGQLEYMRYDPIEKRWTQPEHVFIGRENTFIADANVAVDPTGRIHVVWSEYQAPEFYPPTGVYYSQSIDGGLTWTFPEEIAGRGHVEPEIVVIGDNQVHIVWNGSAILNNRYHRYSNDGGRSWSDIYVIKAPGGILGPPALVVDSADRLHAIVSGDPGLFYTFWSEERGWSPSQNLWPDTQTGDPAAVITGGNQLHIVFREITKRIWYMKRTLDSPTVPLEPLPEPDVLQINSEKFPPNPDPTPTTTNFSKPVRRDFSISGNLETTSAPSSPGWPLIIALSPVVLIILMVAIVKFMAIH